MMNTNYIMNLIQIRKNELFELLSSLIKINSESFKSCGNEEEIARYIHITNNMKLKFVDEQHKPFLEYHRKKVFK